MRKRNPGVICRNRIAPCGMNCALCIGYLRSKNRCDGCRSSDGIVPEYCKKCVIRNCKKLSKFRRPFCFECDTFPCSRLKRLDKRYRTKCGMSMLANLESIRDSGIRKFVRNERIRWECGNCGAVLSVHRKDCIYCGHGKCTTQLNPEP
ncbi:MAG: DUF3795 domain-containing protein [Acidobacteriota bacterium]